MTRDEKIKNKLKTTASKSINLRSKVPFSPQTTFKSHRLFVLPPEVRAGKPRTSEDSGPQLMWDRKEIGSNRSSSVISLYRLHAGWRQGRGRANSHQNGVVETLQ
ncbi:hypothetical protein DPEC_G00194660 [Dallia pectoralis]|uniref:Uncharacterized protein n=1 Tax=Dallia pectoralis TaxID=75939 RepID=A0ACC2G7F2_DALPE|nr:hypothetical protein DPEC_G00194660 [Dallia pectoralis]